MAHLQQMVVATTDFLGPWILLGSLGLNLVALATTVGSWAIRRRKRRLEEWRRNLPASASRATLLAAFGRAETAEDPVTIFNVDEMTFVQRGVNPGKTGSKYEILVGASRRAIRNGARRGEPRLVTKEHKPCGAVEEVHEPFAMGPVGDVAADYYEAELPLFHEAALRAKAAHDARLLAEHETAQRARQAVLRMKANLPSY